MKYSFTDYIRGNKLPFEIDQIVSISENEQVEGMTILLLKNGSRIHVSDPLDNLLLVPELKAIINGNQTTTVEPTKSDVETFNKIFKLSDVKTEEQSVPHSG